jgi:hypothetical protein
MTTRPRCQRNRGRTTDNDQRIGLAAAAIISLIAGCQPWNEATGTSAPTSATDPSAIHCFGPSTTAKKLIELPLPPMA